jgi:nuclear transport factor 2 (NTF2) superfamily protein
MPTDAEFLTRVYGLFNTRDMENVLAAMHRDVTWANGMDGGYVHGQEGVRDYWTRQWAMLDPHVEPVGFSAGEDGATIVRVHQTVHDIAGNLLADKIVGHIFHIDGGLIRRFDIAPES